MRTARCPQAADPQAPGRDLERNVVVRACGGFDRDLRTSAGCGRRTRPAPPELHRVGGDLPPRALAPVLRLVLAALEATVDEDCRALGEILGAGLRLLGPRDDVDEEGLLPLVALHHECAVDRQTEVGNRPTGRRVTEVGV